MNYKLTLGLLGLLIALGAYVYFSEVRPEPRAETKPTEVLSFKAADVNLIQASYQGKSTELVKDESRWKMTKPEDSETETFQVDGLVARLTPLNASRALTGTVEPLSAYGLDKPQLEATLGTTDKRSEVIQVGDNTPDGRLSYVKRKDSDQVYVVSSSLISEVIKLVTNPPKALPTPTPAPEPAETPTPIGTPTS